MRCCWLLAIGLVIGLIGWQETFADDSTINASQPSGLATGINDDAEAQLTLSALKTVVRVPPRRYSATDAGRPTPVVRLAKPSPYAPAKPDQVPAPLDDLPARLVSHSEANALPATSISEETPEVSLAPVRPAAAFTPSPDGDLEAAPAALPAHPLVVAEEKPVVANPIRQAEPSTIQFEAPAKLLSESAATIALKTTAEPAKRESSRAGGGFTTNPLRQSSSSSFSSRDVTNPLR